MSITTPGGELAQLELRRLSTVAWLAIALLSILQALTAQNPIDRWQIGFVLGVFIFSSISHLLQTFAGFESSYLPLMMYLLIAPIILGEAPQNTWISYGVLTLFANLYIASIYRRNIAISLMVAITVVQIWVFNQNLTSLSDRADMRLLNNYFSSLWTFGAGFAFIIIRQRYLDASEKIESEIGKLKGRISERFQSISLQNRDDYRNLKLHGTILNTLIFAKNNPEFLKNRQELSKTISKELNELKNTASLQEDSLEKTLSELLSRRTLNRIKVTRVEVSGRISNTNIENNFLEIVREILLNLEKHTTVAEVLIKLHADVNGNILLRITESAHYEISNENLEIRKAEALKSESLKRLLTIAPSQLVLSTAPDGFGLVYTITNLESTDQDGDPREIYRIRNANLVEFAENIGKATAIFGLLFLPGYFLVGIDGNVLTLLVIHALLVSYSVLSKTLSKLWLSVSTFLSLAIPMVISQNVKTCSELSYLPWLLNIIMMTTFIFAIEIRSKYLRWFPIGIITFELLILPQTYPADCQDIFLGSLPAIPILIAFTLVLGSLRKRLYVQDAEQVSSAFVDETNVRKYEEALAIEYKSVISDLEDFNLETLSMSDEVFSSRIENEIQKIRAYLVCSEQFESEIIREIYRFVITRLREGVPTRLNILGDFIYQQDQIARVHELLSELTKILENIPAELTLVKLDTLTFDISVEDKYLDLISVSLLDISNRLINLQVRLTCIPN